MAGTAALSPALYAVLSIHYYFTPETTVKLVFLVACVTSDVVEAKSLRLP